MTDREALRRLVEALDSAAHPLYEVWPETRGGVFGEGVMLGDLEPDITEARAILATPAAPELDEELPEGMTLEYRCTCGPDAPGCYGCEGRDYAERNYITGYQRRLRTAPAELDEELLQQAVHDTSCGYASHVVQEGKDPNPCGFTAWNLAFAYRAAAARKPE